MPAYFYFDKLNQKQGPVSEEHLKELAAAGIIKPDSPLETVEGHKGLAKQIPGLSFNAYTIKVAITFGILFSVLPLVIFLLYMTLPLWQQVEGRFEDRTAQTERTVEIPIREGEKFTVSNLRNGENETFSVSLFVQVRRSEQSRFTRVYDQRTNEITDRIISILGATTTAERQEIGYTAIKEKVRRGINDVLGTPWVQQVFLRDPNLAMN